PGRPSSPTRPSSTTPTAAPGSTSRRGPGTTSASSSGAASSWGRRPPTASSSARRRATASRGSGGGRRRVGAPGATSRGGWARGGRRPSEGLPPLPPEAGRKTIRGCAMLGWLVGTSLRYRVVVVVGAAALFAVGVVDASRPPLDVFPEFAPPLVEVQVEAPGMSSEAVENLVTVPIESSLNGLPGMTTLRSKSVQGLSSVQVLFQPGTNVFQARQMVSERVSVAAAHLPQQAKAPVVMPPLSSTSRVLKIGLTPKLRS